MEIRIENSIYKEQAERLRNIFNTMFQTDFQIHMDGDYIYFRDN